MKTKNIILIVGAIVVLCYIYMKCIKNATPEPQTPMGKQQIGCPLQPMVFRLCGSDEGGLHQRLGAGELRTISPEQLWQNQQPPATSRNPSLLTTEELEEIVTQNSMCASPGLIDNNRVAISLPMI